LALLFDLVFVGARHDLAQAMRALVRAPGVTVGTSLLLGLGVAATTTLFVTAPIDGVVLGRGANIGLNVDSATRLFTVADLSTVWVMADLYEKDFSKVSGTARR